MNTTMTRWATEEDELLAETVLSYITEGKTQSQAYEDVSAVLESRTPSACDFHWNELRKQEKYAKLLAEAKANRKERKYRKKEKPNQTEVIVGEAREAVIVMPKEEPKPVEVKTSRQIYDQLVASMEDVLNMHEAKDQIIAGLRDELGQANARIAQLERDNARMSVLQEDMRKLAEAFEFARKIVLAGEDVKGHTFQMDTNGNLERKI